MASTAGGGWRGGLEGLFFVNGRLIAARRGNHDDARAQEVEAGRAGALALPMRYPGIDD